MFSGVERSDTKNGSDTPVHDQGLRPDTRRQPAATGAFKVFVGTLLSGGLERSDIKKGSGSLPGIRTPPF
jgi:hypothetical protein